MAIICKFCNKEYSSYSSRSNHIKKYHTDNNDNSLIMSDKVSSHPSDKSLKTSDKSLTSSNKKYISVASLAPLT